LVDAALRRAARGGLRGRAAHRPSASRDLARVHCTARRLDLGRASPWPGPSSWSSLIPHQVFSGAPPARYSPRSLGLSSTARRRKKKAIHVRRSATRSRSSSLPLRRTERAAAGMAPPDQWELCGDPKISSRRDLLVPFASSLARYGGRACSAFLGPVRLCARHRAREGGLLSPIPLLLPRPPALRTVSAVLARLSSAWALGAPLLAADGFDCSSSGLRAPIVGSGPGPARSRHRHPSQLALRRRARGSPGSAKIRRSSSAPPTRAAPPSPRLSPLADCASAWSNYCNLGHLFPQRGPVVEFRERQFRLYSSPLPILALPPLPLYCEPRRAYPHAHRSVERAGLVGALSSPLVNLLYRLVADRGSRTQSSARMHGWWLASSAATTASTSGRTSTLPALVRSSTGAGRQSEPEAAQSNRRAASNPIAVARGSKSRSPSWPRPPSVEFAPAPTPPNYPPHCSAHLPRS